jgi:hypothetical protein
VNHLDAGDESEGNFVPANVARLLASHLPLDRVEGGRWLAQRAGEPMADSVLLQLLLMDENTLVPHEVAEVLLERRDLSASRVVARAVADSDHRDLIYHWILDAVENVWMQTEEGVRVAQDLCLRLADDLDPIVATGARELLAFTGTGKRR